MARKWQSAAKVKAGAGGSVSAEKTLLQSIVKHRTLYLMFLPVAAYYVIFRYWPIALAWIVAFKDLRLGMSVLDSEWVGWANFKVMFDDPEIVNVLMNTVEISLLRLIVGFVPPIVLAIMFHDLASKRLRSWLQSAVYIPHFFSWVIIFGIVFAFFSTGSGFVNNVLERFGLERYEFFLSEGWFRPILVGSALWKEIGWSTIIYLAALSTVDPQLYEAARIDGAGPLRRIVSITLPGILSVITFVLCLSLGNILFAGGEQILLFYNKAVLDTADVIETWVYREGLGRLQFSIGTAVGIFQSFIGMVVIVISNALAKRYTGRGIW
ncbi:ABC transporter permease [Cohnella phaseoli]|uniref:Putative aldouronate transport system permease protein n=1 Tax=Cohnella phaseoli TaxID=456490 RepID=A0A3D9IME7_9BACL|nr:ABC transporter permease subunit [Cohnella phaseoli]RED62932.1 putative aldouronate transport system permease protein [Cohnella phaseoli]